MAKNKKEKSVVITLEGETTATVAELKKFFKRYWLISCPGLNEDRCSVKQVGVLVIDKTK